MGASPDLVASHDVNNPQFQNPDDGYLPTVQEQFASAIYPTQEAPAAIVVGVSGFGVSASSGGPLGVAEVVDSIEQMHSDASSSQVGWASRDEIVEQITAATLDHPNTPVILVGHSYGADTVLEVAEDLGYRGIDVQAVYTIDPVGQGNDEVPENVDYAVNIASTSLEGVDGKQIIDGAINVGVPDTTHTEIDNLPSVQGWISDHADAVIALSDRDLSLSPNTLFEGAFLAAGDTPPPAEPAGSVWSSPLDPSLSAYDGSPAGVPMESSVTDSGRSLFESAYADTSAVPFEGVQITGESGLFFGGNEAGMDRGSPWLADGAVESQPQNVDLANSTPVTFETGYSASDIDAAATSSSFGPGPTSDYSSSFESSTSFGSDSTGSATSSIAADADSGGSGAGSSSSSDSGSGGGGSSSDSGAGTD